jgi:NAD(P)H-hydrate epimerase
MCGAIALAGLGALRSGAGLVQLAIPECCHDAVVAIEPSYLTFPLPADGQGRISAALEDRLAELAGAATAVGCGPGLGRSAALDALVARLYTQLPRPLVVDADALNTLADSPELLRTAAGPRLLTPHPGEFGRLLRLPTHEVQARRQELACEFAARHQVVVVLKGHGTVISNGSSTVLNPTGNPGMATGGSGDVLLGIITALLGQGLSAFDAAVLGAHVHGLTGDLAVQELGQVSLIASDLVDYLPAAYLSLQGGS